MRTEPVDYPEHTVPRCRTCLRQSETPVCTACATRGAGQLGEIPSLLDRLTYTAVGSSAGIREYVSGAGYESRPPAALAALALTAVTPDEIGLNLVDPQPPNPTGDSIPVWVTAWAAVWRHRWGHSQPAGVRPIRRKVRPRKPLPTDPAERMAVLFHVRAVATARRVARLEEQRSHAEYMATVVLGLAAGQVRDAGVEGGWRALPSGVVDQVADNWTARFGSPRRARRLMVDLGYLTTWLDTALEAFDDADEFILGLRSLVAASRAAVGDRSDLVTLGRCPTQLLDRATGEEQPCGAWLTRDPMVTVLICPRCKTETPEKGLLALARQMRDVYGNPRGNAA